MTDDKGNKCKNTVDLRGKDANVWCPNGHLVAIVGRYDQKNIELCKTQPCKSCSETTDRTEGSCWFWPKAKSGTYARVSVNGKGVGLHRHLYELLNGKIGDGLVIDHLCRNTHCVNPAHMEAVTNKENVLRGEGFTAKNARKTHCANGHEFTEENTRVLVKKGFTERECLTCKKDLAREYGKKRYAAHLAAGGGKKWKTKGLKPKEEL